MKIFILGHGGFARETAYVFDDCMLQNEDVQEITGFLSDDTAEHGKLVMPTASWPALAKLTLLGSIESVEVPDNEEIFFVAAVGSPELRKKLAERAFVRGWKPVRYLDHGTAWIGDAEIGDGSIICANCSITTNVTIGKFVNVNLNCTIGHDVILEDYVNLSPHCTISGHVTIEEGCDLGSGADILPGVTIGEHSVIGAGSVVTKDVPPYSLVVGVPGKVIRSLKDDAAQV